MLKLKILIICFAFYKVKTASSINITDNAKAVFHNPILDVTWPDPYCYLHTDGFYYMPRRADDRKGITLHKSKSLINWRDAEVSVIYYSPEGLMSLWAPEIHFIDGNFYIYFAMDDGNNANHRMYAIRALDSNNPLGAYTPEKRLIPPSGEDVWAIDATVLKYGNGKMYLIWSGWPTINAEFPQNIYIAPMSDALTISGPRVLLNEPTLPWQQHGEPLLEGPQVLQNPIAAPNRTFLIYSASGSWTPDYQLGLMSIDDLKDPLVPSNWVKNDQPVFTRNDAEKVYGVGHASFTTSKDGKESWIVYHAMPSSDAGWDGRTARAQKFDWDLTNKLPIFPKALGYDASLETPSGE